MEIRRSDTRGHARHGWLDSRHTFSFGHWYDPRHMGVSDLRVINEDRVQPGQGFGTHPHQNMEIISYVLAGTLAHRDSMGNVETIPAGDVQVMSAGTGITHSEFNHSQQDEVHFLQIWILPEADGLEPSYAQRNFADRQGAIQVAGRNPEPGVLPIHQDAAIWIYRGKAGENFSPEIAAGRSVYVQVSRGNWQVQGQTLEAGDGAQLNDATGIELHAQSDAELLLFDLRHD